MNKTEDLTGSVEDALIDGALHCAKASEGTSCTNWLCYAEAVLSANTLEEVWQIHCQKMAEYGFDRMLYGANQFRSHGEFGNLSDWMILTNHSMDYLSKFFGRRLYEDAPMTVWVARNTGVCSWAWAVARRARGESSQKENMIMDFNAKYGVSAGYSISFQNISLRRKAGIGLCAEVGLSQDDVEAIWARNGREIVILNKLMNLKVSTLPFVRNTETLTKRQREVLQWVADGKSVQDIATIMGLTRVTVEKHLRLARKALDADTTAQAVMKASMQNQLFVFEGVDGDEIANSAQLMAKELT